MASMNNRRNDMNMTMTVSEGALARETDVHDHDTKILVNQEFEGLLPGLSDEELRLLERKLLTYGCEYPLRVWRNYLADGYASWRICRRLNIPFETRELDLPDR